MTPTSTPTPAVILMGIPPSGSSGMIVSIEKTEAPNSPDARRKPFPAKPKSIVCPEAGSSLNA